MFSTQQYFGFDPRTIPGCQLWLDAADPAGNGTKPSNGSTLTSWVDKSGNSRNLGVGSGTTTWNTNSVRLNSSYMFVTSAVNLSSVSFFIVVASPTAVNNQTVFIGRPNTVANWNSTDGFGFYIDNNNGTRIYGQSSAGQNTSFANTGSTATFMTSAVFTSSGSFSSWTNGGTQANATMGTRGTTAQGFSIGGEWSGTSYTNIISSAYIYEIVVYNTALSTTERQQVEGYLAWKWGLQTSLPTGHPNRTNPTTMRMFRPIDIPGCQVWIDAADSSTITLSGTSVTSIRDKAQNIAFNTQGTASFLTVVPNSIQDQQSLYFDNTAANNVSLLGAHTQPAAFSMFVVWKHLTQRSGSYRNIVGWQYVSPPNPGAFNFGYPGSQTGSNVGIWDTYNGSIGTLLSVANNTNYIGYAQFGTPSLSLNGNTPSSTSLSVTSGAPNLYIGGIGTQLVAMNLGEVIIYNSVLTTSQRQQVEGYLAAKWRLSSSLPTTHPTYLLRALPSTSI